jgi:hypothetical protein
VSNLREQVTTLKQKLLVAENARRKLHNELQARHLHPNHEHIPETHPTHPFIPVYYRLLGFAAPRYRLGFCEACLTEQTANRPRWQELKGNIRVFARVRPSDERCALSIDDENGTIAVPYGGSFSNFKFDRAFAPLSTQEVRRRDATRRLPRATRRA